MAEKLKFYRIDEIPKGVLDRFDAAADEIRTSIRSRGGSHVSETAAFVALMRGVDLDDAITVGQALAGAQGPGEERISRGFHIPLAEKTRLVEVANRRGIKVGAIGKLVLIARAERLTETIEAGLVAMGHRAAATLQQPAEEVPA